MLSERDVYQYLTEKRLVNSHRAVGGDLEIDSLLRRHQCFVARQGPSAYFVKTTSDVTRASALANEARIYKALRRSEHPYTYMPSLIDHDDGLPILVTDYVAGSAMREQIYKSGRITRSAARQVGSCLGHLHGRPLPSSEMLPSVPLPWVFSVHQPSIAFVNEMSVATRALLKIIHSDENYRELIVQARKAWRHDAVIHNDVRWDNVLSSASGDQVWLVDWELGGVGAASWDVAGLVCEVLGVWLHSIPVLPHSSSEDWVDLAEVPIRKLRRPLSDFFHAYIGVRKVDDAEAERLMDDAVLLTGMRLIQAAVEQSQLSSALAAYPVLALQLAINILNDPCTARRDLLKLGIE